VCFLIYFQIKNKKRGGEEKSMRLNPFKNKKAVPVKPIPLGKVINRI
jgi:hypothetical protein